MARKSPKDLRKGRREYAQAYDGEWMPIPWRGFREQCCECALIHVVDYRVVNGTLEFRCSIDKRATTAARKGYGMLEADDDD